MASDDEVAMPTGAKNEVEMPPAPDDQVDHDEMQLHNASQSGQSHLAKNQTDGTSDTQLTRFDPNPITTEKARTQGIAFLRAFLNDPKKEIAEEIFKTKGFKGQHSENERCRTVQKFLTGNKEVDDNSVTYVLAVWCMLGGTIPRVWEKPREGTRTGNMKPLTSWGIQMLKELDQLFTGSAKGLQHLKVYSKGIPPPSVYNAAEAAEVLENMAKRPKPKKRKATEVTASPRRSPSAKRVEMGPVEDPEGSEDPNTGDEDGIQTTTMLGNHRNKRFVGVSRHDAIPRSYGPGLNQANKDINQGAVPRSIWGKQYVTVPDIPRFTKEHQLWSKSTSDPNLFPSSWNTASGRSHDRSGPPSHSGQFHATGSPRNPLSSSSQRPRTTSSNILSTSQTPVQPRHGNVGQSKKIPLQNKGISFTSSIAPPKDRGGLVTPDEAVIDRNDSKANVVGARPTASGYNDFIHAAQSDVSSPVVKVNNTFANGVIDRYKELEEINETLRKENNSLKTRKSSLKKENKSLKEENLPLKKEIDILQKENGILQADNQNLQTKLEDLVNRLDNTSPAGMLQLVLQRLAPMSLSEMLRGKFGDDDMDTPAFTGPEDQQDRNIGETEHHKDTDGAGGNHEYVEVSDDSDFHKGN